MSFLSRVRFAIRTLHLLNGGKIASAVSERIKGTGQYHVGETGFEEKGWRVGLYHDNSDNNMSPGRESINAFLDIFQVCICMCVCSFVPYSLISRFL